MKAGPARPEFSARDLSERLADRVDQLVPQLLPAAQKIAGYWRVGSLDGEKGQSLAIYTQFGRAGRWVDYASGDRERGRGDLLDLIRLTQGFRSAGEAMRWAKDWLGLGNADPRDIAIRRSQAEAAARVRQQDDELKQQWAVDLWERGRDPRGTAAGLYLHNRNITLALPASLRMVPELRHKQSETRWPALLGRVQAVDGETIGCWRIWLGRRDDGQGPWDKAPISPNKMGLGPCRGGWVMIHHVLDCRRVIITEGIEDALAIRERYRSASIIAALSASLMRVVVLPPHWDDVVIFADRDEKHIGRGGEVTYPGQDAANALGIRLMAEGRAAKVAVLRDDVAAKDPAAALKLMRDRQAGAGAPAAPAS